MEKMILLGKTPAEIQEVVEKLELPKFTGKQIVDWIYQKRCASIEDMTNLSKSARALPSRNRCQPMAPRNTSSLQVNTLSRLPISPTENAPRCASLLKWAAKWIAFSVPRANKVSRRTFP